MTVKSCGVDDETSMCNKKYMLSLNLSWLMENITTFTTL